MQETLQKLKNTNDQIKKSLGLDSRDPKCVSRLIVANKKKLRESQISSNKKRRVNSLYNRGDILTENSFQNSQETAQKLISPQQNPLLSSYSFVSGSKKHSRGNLIQKIEESMRKRSGSFKNLPKKYSLLSKKLSEAATPMSRRSRKNIHHNYNYSSSSKKQHENTLRRFNELDSSERDEIDF